MSKNRTIFICILFTCVWSSSPNFIGNKTGLFQRARNNRYRRWLETLPPRKKIAIELGVALPLMILMDHYILMPYLGMAMLPWNWDWSGG